jgi:hypothetical protein
MATLFASDFVRGPECRAAYTQGLFKLQKNEKSGRENYMVTLLYSKQADLSILLNLAQATAKGAWPNKTEAVIKAQLENGLIKNPFLDGDGKQGLSRKTGERKEGFAGCWFLRATSGPEFKPAVFDGNLLPIVELAGFRSGWYGFPVLNCFAWNNTEQGDGLTFGIRMIQLSRKGELLGGGGGGDADPDQFFQKIEDTGPVDGKVKDSGKGAGSLFG